MGDECEDGLSKLEHWQMFVCIWMPFHVFLLHQNMSQGPGVVYRFKGRGSWLRAYINFVLLDGDTTPPMVQQYSQMASIMHYKINLRCTSGSVQNRRAKRVIKMNHKPDSSWSKNHRGGPVFAVGLVTRTWGLGIPGTAQNRVQPRPNLKKVEYKSSCMVA